jgi:hypothetical protein
VAYRFINQFRKYKEVCMKKLFYAISAIFLTFLFTHAANAELGGQVFFRGGISSLSNDRGEEIFTSAYPVVTEPLNDGSGDWYFSAGLDIPLTKLGNGTALGEVMLEYSRFSEERVVNAVYYAAVEGVQYASVPVSEFIAVVAPKYRFEQFGAIRPWIIPVGVAFMVNSPPSNVTTYLDLGTHHAAGVEYNAGLVSVGLDIRYTNSLGFAGGETETPELAATEVDYLTYGLYLGVNF